MIFILFLQNQFKINNYISKQQLYVLKIKTAFK